ncbi:type II toxin-antitoxin system PemK/MazF family toxin [Helicobacter bizzozeronii]|uniref:type II toxin-antitoxin system PemK/MazF family toxin n=1 Tax=Helicobacter bizzozeronii TaxID=56877 RepID=UPI002557A79C|nr:type II toxin-antitoxin system PemK/MazF family toxin [Helicobacter bizzozeronii]
MFSNHIKATLEATQSDLPNYGKSANFTRPVLVIKLLSHKPFLGVPLSSQTHKKHMPYHHAFTDNNGTEQIALLHQTRIFDTKHRHKIFRDWAFNTIVNY